MPERTGTSPSPTEAATAGRRRRQPAAPLLAGACAAALGAFLAELAFYQAATRFRLRVQWAVSALRLPAQVVRDTGIVFAALWRRLARGQELDSGFRELPCLQKRIRRRRTGSRQRG